MRMATPNFKTPLSWRKTVLFDKVLYWVSSSSSSSSSSASASSSASTSASSSASASAYNNNI